jgi:hypothetical protein
MGGGTGLALGGLVTMWGGCETTPARPVESLAFEKRTERYLVGLDETIAIVKGLPGGYVIREDGSLDSLISVLEANERAWRNQHGSLSPELVTYSQTVEPTTLVDVAFVFDPLEDWEDYLQSQISGDPEWEEEQRELLHQAIAEGADVIVEQLEAEGIEIDRVGEWIPFVHARVPASDLDVVANLEGVDRIVADGTAEAVETGNVNVANIATFHGKGSLPGFDGGAGSRAGILDPGVCRIRGTHNLINAPITYQPGAGTFCVTALDCGQTVCGDIFAGPPACLNNQCIDGHGTQTASVLARFVPDADIWYPSAGNSISTGQTCSKNLSGAYDWFQGGLVKHVNESFECINLDDPNTISTVDGVTQDYFTRVHNFFITKAAGNTGPNSYACKDSWNSFCVGGFDAERQFSCFSAATNPLNPSSARIDREEPDGMAYAGQNGTVYNGQNPQCTGVADLDTLTVATTTSNTSTGSTSGTSYAAPAVLGMEMLTKQYCVSLGRNWSSVGYRSVLRTAGYAANIDGWNYSTLKWDQFNQQLIDHADGGGGVYLEAASRFCNQPNTGNEEWGVLDAIRRPSGEGTTTNVPNLGGSPDTPPQRQDWDPGPGLTGYRWLDLWENKTMTFPAGTRVRATFSWEACALSKDPTSTTRKVTTDYDLFLFRKPAGGSDPGEAIYSSQTNDDVNEGFDVVIPSGDGGNYSLILIWPDGSTGCGGNERTALSWYIKKPS